MATASSMIIASQIAIGEKQVGDTLNAAEQVFYLDKLNSMLASWANERLMCYQILQESFTLVAGTISYNIGTGATFNTTRPTRITYAFIRDSGAIDNELEILPYDAYDGLALKSTGNTYPSYLFYDTAWTAGIGTINLYPAPTSGLTLFIDSWKQLQSFAAITDVLSLPPGYQRAIESNFAIEIAPGLTPVSAELMRIAKESKAAIKSMNLPTSILLMDAGVVRWRSGSILTGP